MRRFFVSPQDLIGPNVPLNEEICRHLAVLRLSTGAEIDLLDGLGTICRCRIEGLSKKGGTARVLECRQNQEDVFPIRLLQGLPKGDKMDLILQKGTELGITAFSPVIAGRTIPLLPSGREEQRLRRWEHIIREAARQCRRPLLPRLNSPQPLATALTSTEEEMRLLLWEDGNCPLAKVLPVERPRNAAILVGPEGGFSQQEADAAKASGFIPVGIGPRILRSETAGFAVAAILQFTYGDLAASGARNDRPSN